MFEGLSKYFGFYRSKLFTHPVPKPFESTVVHHRKMMKEFLLLL
jgi:hypothetical protein